jgi:hypothetical protein
MSNILIAKATAALQESVASIIGCDENDATKREALVETFAQFQTYLEREAGDDIAKARDRHDIGGKGLASATAELALDLIHHHRRRLGLVAKGGGQLEESNMRTESLEGIMKSAGIGATCAGIVAKGSTTISQDELVAAASKVAHERWSGLSESQAFNKVYSDPGPEGRSLREAINVAKASLAETMLGPGLPVTVVGGPAAQDVDNATEAEQARAELMRIGRKQWPRLTEQAAYEQAFSDPRNATIVSRLYQRPTPTSIYPMPREWLGGEGSQHAKADRGSAYGDLMAKAEEYRNSHPNLSIAQAFEKVFTAPANRELAKRERVENASFGNFSE